MVQYDVSTPAEYLAALEDDWRKEKLLQLRAMIQTAAPEVEEGLAYKMLSYGVGDDQFMALNAQKHYVSLYVGDIEKIENSEELLKEFNLGKGCVRVREQRLKIADLGRIGRADQNPHLRFSPSSEPHRAPA